VVYAKKPFGGPRKVLDYLGRYTHRVALSNNRILDVSHGQVRFRWKDYRSRGRQKSRAMTLSADEFIRRFLIHTLPPGFRRIRYFGLMASRFRKEKLALCRNLLSDRTSELLPAPAQCGVVSAAPHPQLKRCPQCRKGILICTGIVSPYRWPARPPDSS
jgi:hypothetical protein